MNCIIVDDEPLALELLLSYAKKTPFLNVKGSFSNAIEAMSFLSSNEIRLIFLDIQMPELTGIEFSRMVPKETKIIFTTAFSEYAIDGYKVSALDYLLKPINYDEFLSAALKAKDWFSRTEINESEKGFIFVKSEYKQIKIELNDIQYIEGLKDYVKIFLINKPQAILTLLSLKKLEEQLPSKQFMRVHRSFIVALDKIEAVERGQILINKQRITVADQYKDAFNNFISGKSI